jgi:hypothetical protein
MQLHSHPDGLQLCRFHVPQSTYHAIMQAAESPNS